MTSGRAFDKHFFTFPRYGFYDLTISKVQRLGGVGSGFFSFVDSMIFDVEIYFLGKAMNGPGPLVYRLRRIIPV